MEVEKHLNKASRYENTIKKLDLEDDCETIIEDCALAGTHLLNAIHHVTGALDRDVVHTDILTYYIEKDVYMRGPQPNWDALDAPTKKKVKTARSALREIEEWRRTYVRGGKISSSVAKKSIEKYETIKNICLKLIKKGSKVFDLGWY